MIMITKHDNRRVVVHPDFKDTLLLAVGEVIDNDKSSTDENNLNVIGTSLSRDEAIALRAVLDDFITTERT